MKALQFSARASLAMAGIEMQQSGIWRIVEQTVHIPQKVIKHTPTDKLLDAFINVLAGGHGLVEVNTRVRPDTGVQRAFGRDGCADQSTISETLNKCDDATVIQMRDALQALYRQQSQGYQHPYAHGWQILDIDMTGMPAGRGGEGVTKGYFAGAKNRRGRQLGRVVATLYDEIVVERLYNGKVQLDRSLQALVTASEEVLGLNRRRRQRTILRVDAGGGRDADVNWMLARDYHVLVKVKHYRRSAKLARSVTTWYPDPKVNGREVGWVEQPHEYERKTRQLAIRNRKKNGQWSYHVLVFTLTDAMLFWLAQRPMPVAPTTAEVLFTVLAAYDLRSGGVETTVRGSKYGLGLTKRNKRNFAAQEMLVLLAQLAYNFLSWLRTTFTTDHRLQRFGVLRIVRDLLHIPGKLALDAQGRVQQITLSNRHPLARPLLRAVRSHWSPDDIVLTLGEI